MYKYYIVETRVADRTSEKYLGMIIVTTKHTAQVVLA